MKSLAVLAVSLFVPRAATKLVPAVEAALAGGPFVSMSVRWACVAWMVEGEVLAARDRDPGGGWPLHGAVGDRSERGAKGCAVDSSWR